MNWLSNLISKPNAHKAKKLSGSDVKSAQTMISHSAPSAIYQDKPPLSVLKQFIPLRNIEDSVIKTLPQSTMVYAPGCVIFCQGEESDSFYYLLSGRISIQPLSENNYVVDGSDTRSLLPLNSGRFGATATALTEVTLLAISGDLNRLWKDQSYQEYSCVELVDIELPEELNDNRFFASFAQAYRENKLQLPSLPDVAFKLKEAMHQDIGVNEAVEIIQIDPPIVTKLIQVANSALYSPTTPITNCHNAVTRLGLEATRTLVMGISLKQLFNCHDKQLMKAMHNLWKNSLYVSSLSFVLAQETGIINPEDALLAGLICDIGIIPLLHFADQHPEQYPNIDDLENSMPYLRAPVGALMLHTLGFSEELSEIPHQAENWLYDSGKQITLADIVILAKLHSAFGTAKAKELPYINTIPAYNKLKNGQLNPDFSLTILHKAQERIQAAMSVLA